MSDISQPSEPRAEKKPRTRVSRRGRRIMGIILVALVILLGVVTFLLVRLLLPAGNAASVDDAGGVEWVRSIYGYGPGKSEQLVAPANAAIAPDGTIWVTDAPGARLLAFNTDGSFKSMVAGATKDPLLLPTDVTVDDQGRIYVAETTQDELHILTSGNQELLVKKIQQPTSVAVSDDRIIVGSKAGFAILDKEGAIIKVVGTEGQADDQFDTVNGIAISKDGTFYVLDTFNNRLSHYSRAGDRLWITPLGKAGNRSSVTNPADNRLKGSKTALQLPSGITFDGNNRLIIVDPFDFSLTAVSPKDGSLIRKYGEYGEEDGKFSYPSSIDYDADHDWFVIADSANNRVQIIRLPDSGGSVLASARRSLTGPLRACLFPLLLILLAIIIGLVWRKIRKRKENSQSAHNSLGTQQEDAALEVGGDSAE